MKLKNVSHDKTKFDSKYFESYKNIAIKTPFLLPESLNALPNGIKIQRNFGYSTSRNHFNFQLISRLKDDSYM